MNSHPYANIHLFVFVLSQFTFSFVSPFEKNYLVNQLFTKTS